MNQGRPKCILWRLGVYQHTSSTEILLLLFLLPLRMRQRQLSHTCTWAQVRWPRLHTPSFPLPLQQGEYDFISSMTILIQGAGCWRQRSQQSSVCSLVKMKVLRPEGKVSGRSLLETVFSLPSLSPPSPLSPFSPHPPPHPTPPLLLLGSFLRVNTDILLTSFLL